MFTSSSSWPLALVAAALVSATGCAADPRIPGGTGGHQGAEAGADTGADADAGPDAAADDSFVLSWQDDFDALDTASWQLQTFTFGGNGSCEPGPRTPIC